MIESAPVLGIDLAASPRRPTGICLLSGPNAELRLAFSDEDIAAAAPDVRLISIDAPLSLPEGRCCLRSDCTCARGPHSRRCEREIRKLGIRILPLTLGPMRALTRRGIALKRRFEDKGLKVIETFPLGAQAIWNLPGKKDAAGLLRGLKAFGLSGDIGKRDLSPHELDALTCALVGRSYLKREFFVAGDPQEGQIILPRLSK